MAGYRCGHGRHGRLAIFPVRTIPPQRGKAFLRTQWLLTYVGSVDSNEIGWDYPPLLEQLSTLQSIHHLGTGRADSSSRLELPLKCPLRSLSIFYEWFEEETVAAWSRILKESSSSLRALHLSFNTRTISAQSIDKTLPTLLTDPRTSMPIALPQLEELYLRVREEMPSPYWQSL